MRLASSKIIILVCLLMPGIGQAVDVNNYFGFATGYGIKHQSDPANDLMDSGEKVYLGIRLFGHLGIEVAYYDLGRYDNETSDVTVVGASAVFSRDIRGMTIFAKAGLVEWREKDLASGATLDDTDASYGIGINLAVDRHVLFRTELERFKNVGRNTATADQGDDMSLFSFGVNFQF